MLCRYQCDFPRYKKESNMVRWLNLLGNHSWQKVHQTFPKIAYCVCSTSYFCCCMYCNIMRLCTSWQQDPWLEMSDSWRCLCDPCDLSYSSADYQPSRHQRTRRPCQGHVRQKSAPACDREQPLLHLSIWSVPFSLVIISDHNNRAHVRGKSRTRPWNSNLRAMKWRQEIDVLSKFQQWHGNLP